MVREIELRARAILAREPTGDVDVHELATLALDLVTRLDHDQPYRGEKHPPGADAQLGEMAALERQLADCRMELARALQRLAALGKG